MLEPNASNVPYEGWSSTYSVASILMQLQLFLFAEKIEQDGRYQVNSQLRDREATYSIKYCKTFKCTICEHSHDTPWPEVKGGPEGLIKVFPTDPQSGNVTVQGAACQTSQSFVIVSYPPKSVSIHYIFVYIYNPLILK